MRNRLRTPAKQFDLLVWQTASVISQEPCVSVAFDLVPPRPEVRLATPPAPRASGEAEDLNFVTGRNLRAGSNYLLPQAVILPRILQGGVTYNF